MIVESRDVKVCFIDDEGERQCFDALKLEIEMKRDPDPDFESAEYVTLAAGLRSVSYAIEGHLTGMTQLVMAIYGCTERKAKRLLSRHARRARHLAYQTSRKIRRR